MAVMRGLKVPCAGDGRGKLELVAGDEYLMQLLFVALGDCSSDNPFVDVGLDAGLIFDLNDEVSQGRLRERVRRVLAEFEAEGLMKLAPNRDLEVVAGAEEGELQMLVPVVMLESNRETTLRVPNRR
jgi:hypothetical protein